MDTDGRTGNQGIDRRALIRRAATVGAAAWATPLVLESLTSPAGALTPGPCQPYWLKLETTGGCNSNLPGSGAGRVCGVANASVSFPLPAGVKCGSACSAGCSTPNASLTPSIFLNGSGYYEVNLTAGSSFSSTLSWTLGGRYDTSSSLNNSSYTRLCACGANTGDGAYVDGGTTGWVRRQVTFGTGPRATTKTLQYLYVMFCRST